MPQQTFRSMHFFVPAPAPCDCLERPKMFKSNDKNVKDTVIDSALKKQQLTLFRTICVKYITQMKNVCLQYILHRNMTKAN